MKLESFDVENMSRNKYLKKFKCRSFFFKKNNRSKAMSERDYRVRNSIESPFGRFSPNSPYIKSEDHNELFKFSK
jgi:hypothetical protein